MIVVTSLSLGHAVTATMSARSTITISDHLFILAFLELLNEFSKRSQFASVYQVELVDKVDEMFEAGIEMSLSGQKHNVLKVSVINVSVHPE